MAHYNRVSSVFRELTNLRVLIDKVVYMPTLEAPPDRPYPFVYFITIDNQSSETVTIRGRKWVITDQLGQKIVVEGDGVVGGDKGRDPPLQGRAPARSGLARSMNIENANIPRTVRGFAGQKRKCVETCNAGSRGSASLTGYA